ncbi:ABC transporter permease [Haloquadratum walsbyi]|jgi:ABC-type nitrate/sulfonate/bicarbonate transport system, permease component|uniref:ABC-type nitrate/sulfonate/bicarbonate transport system, permease component n=1 Tax=Haloquadratum walsbyi J07HQW2 TaxID=1238425 RepID=U1NBS5_9EURY|nr:ABC transporter permease [Haloquadratum walsbyi]ERG94345.1 MAG: ABC-type nitrate/sulfonate/bicarbonate transport system, permease component [Haloquadratum walsbyi J07HQW2]
MATKEERQYSSEVGEEAGKILPLAGLGGGLIAWYLVTTLSSGVITNFHPADTFMVLTELLSTQSFYAEHIYISLYRFGISLVLCVSVGIPLGILVGFFTPAERAATVLLQFMRMISPLAWFPIAIIVFGVGTGSSVFVMFMAGVWPILLNTAHGISTIDEDWVTVAESLGGDTRSIIQRIVVPGVVPDILTGLRLAVGILWIILVPAEMLGVNSGLGYYILDARDRFAYAEIPAVMLIIGFIGYWLDLGIRWLHTRRTSA